MPSSRDRRICSHDRDLPSDRSPRSQFKMKVPFSIQNGIEPAQQERRCRHQIRSRNRNGHPRSHPIRSFRMVGLVSCLGNPDALFAGHRVPWLRCASLKWLDPPQASHPQVARVSAPTYIVETPVSPMTASYSSPRRRARRLGWNSDNPADH